MSFLLVMMSKFLLFLLFVCVLSCALLKFRWFVCVVLCTAFSVYRYSGRFCYAFHLISVFCHFVTFSVLSFNAMCITFASVVFSL